jgi:VWFA-related protein
MSALRTLRTRAVIVVAVVMVCTVVAVGLAQQATFRAGVELVVIDVNVVQKPSWTPVGDLKPEDFTVAVDRQPRNIVSAVYVSHGVGRPGQLSVDAMGGVDLPAGLRVNDIGRHVLIVVDEESLETTDAMMARNAIRRMVDRLAPAERIGVVTIPHLPATMTFTTERADVYKAIEKIGRAAVPGPTGVSGYSVGLWEALEMERNANSVAETVIQRVCGNPEDQRYANNPLGYQSCRAEAVYQAHITALQAKIATTRSHDALRAIGEALREIEGPKILVLVSGGLAAPESEHEWSEVEKQLAAGQATFYTVFIEKSVVPSLAQPPSPSFFDDRRVERAGIENLTGAVGGTFIHVIGQIEPAFDRVAQEISGTYLLGIEVLASDRDGTPHQVDVKVNRPGVEVRARRRYVIPRERPFARPAVDGSLSNAGLKTGVPKPAPAPRPPVTVAVMSPELKAVLMKAGEYVTACEVEFLMLAADEATEETVSRMKLTKIGESAEWIAGKRRVLRSEFLLARAPLLAGWLPYRDVYEVDGRQVRKPDARLARLFTESPATAYDQAKKLSENSNRYDIGFIDRNVNQPMIAFLFLKHLNRERFTFIKEGEDVIDGVTAWRVAFAERDFPTFIQGDGNDDVPADGVLWIDPQQGRVLKTTVRLNVEPVETEITVTYRPNPAFGELWVPSEMRETYTAPAIKVESTARYTNIRTLGGGVR